MAVSLEDKILSATEARQQFFRVLEEVRGGQTVTIHQPKREDVTLVPRAFLAQLLKEMEELTMQLESAELAQDAEAMAAIRRSEADIQSGRTVDLSDVKRILKRRRRGNGHR
ncbi:MAG TPA: type II toxin-antitoxin system Phd/YefM family antitoxin [bacterium]|nr:type II toxin-antitoxin system Phd/YefM family antitoxin [bacterium]